MNHIAPPSWVPPSNTHQCTVRPITSFTVTGVVTALPGTCKMRSSLVKTFSFKNRLFSTVKAVFASTKGSQSVTALRLIKCTGPPPRLKSQPLSIKNRAMWNR